MKRIVIIGNSGSGKTYLATQLSTRYSIPLIHLDKLFWEPGGFNIKRPKDMVMQDIDRMKEDSRWIVEGVFGELAARFLENADALVWLDMEWDTFRNNLLHRGSESSKQLDSESAEANFQKLLVWASEYWIRTDLRSHSGHKELFDTFHGRKWVLHSRSDVDLLIRNPSNFA
jgi:adenylate kinase family enzyme